jgi:hypothetical protein
VANEGAAGAAGMRRNRPCRNGFLQAFVAPAHGLGVEHDLERVRLSGALDLDTVTFADRPQSKHEASSQLLTRSFGHET